MERYPLVSSKNLPVWFPVLTMATRSALDLRARVAPGPISEQELT